MPWTARGGSHTPAGRRIGGLGNLFGGLLSSFGYQHFGPRSTDRPDQMWLLFAALASTTAVAPLLYNQWAAPGRSAVDR